MINFKQFYLGCLSHASYYIGSDGEAAIIDPQRDVQQYIDEAEAKFMIVACSAFVNFCVQRSGNSASG